VINSIVITGGELLKVTKIRTIILGNVGVAQEWVKPFNLSGFSANLFKLYELAGIGVKSMPKNDHGSLSP